MTRCAVPAQCPECARFLSKQFVAGLAVEPAPCPKCATELTATQFAEELGQAATPAGPVEEPAAAAEMRAATASVRPPDLDPQTVGAAAGTDRDPLEGWDQAGGRVLDISSYRDRRIAPPPDAAIVAGAGLAGAAIGALLADRRGWGAVLGLFGGFTAGAAARQVWRLED